MPPLSTIPPLSTPFYHPQPPPESLPHPHTPPTLPLYLLLFLVVSILLIGAEIFALRKYYARRAIQLDSGRIESEQEDEEIPPLYVNPPKYPDSCLNIPWTNRREENGEMPGMCETQLPEGGGMEEQETIHHEETPLLCMS